MCTFFLIIRIGDVITRSWIEHIHSMFQGENIIALVQDGVISDSLQELNIAEKVSFAGHETPFFLINSLVQEKKEGWFALLLPETYPNLENVKKLIAILETEQDGLRLGVISLYDKQTAQKERYKDAFVSILDCSDMLYDSWEELKQPVWHSSVHTSMGFFDTQLQYFATGEFVLRVLRYGHYSINALQAGFFGRQEYELTPRYRQAFYEEELLVKENTIRFIFSDTYQPDSQLPELVSKYAKTVATFFKLIQAGKNTIPVPEFDRHVFSYALFASLAKDRKVAKDTLLAFFSVVTESRNCAHLLRILLTPYLDVSHISIPADHDSRDPMVSVIIPLYNHGRYLDKTLAGIAAQTMPHWELLIVNDGSTDDSLPIAKQLIKEYNDPRMRVVSKVNGGPSKTRNYGIRLTRAPFILVLDADDLITAQYFEAALALFANDEDTGWVNPQALLFGGSNQVSWFWEYDLVHSLIKCPCPVSSMFRRSMWEEVGGFKEDISCREDWEFWIKSGEAGWKGAKTDEPMFLYRYAFDRWSQKPKKNITSKQVIYKEHYWWYKPMPDKKLVELFSIHTVSEFPPVLLNPAVVNLVASLQGKNDVKKFVTSLKNNEFFLNLIYSSYTTQTT